MEITIKDKVYEGVDRNDCQGCAFDENYALCGMATSRVDCSEYNIVWVKKQVTPVKVTAIDAPVDQKPGTKYDDEKIQYTLIPPYALQEVARNLTVGLRKYKERDNWKKVEGAEQRYMDALYRHVEAIRRGEIYDNESGAESMPHMAAVVANAMFLLEFMLDPKLKKG